jgi:hypothetical protein
MAGIRAFSFAVAFLTFGFFFLGLTEEGFSGFSADITCCQGDGQCSDTIDNPGFICLVDDVVENAFCNLDTGVCTQVPVVSNIPTLSEWGLIAMAGVLGIAGFLIIRRRKAAA